MGVLRISLKVLGTLAGLGAIGLLATGHGSSWVWGLVLVACLCGVSLGLLASAE
jgi:hypothetical protein